MYLRRDSYKEFAYIYGGIHIKREIQIRSSHVSMTGFIYRERFISGVHMYLWRDSCKEFTYIYLRLHILEGIDIRSSHVSMARFIFRGAFL